MNIFAPYPVIIYLRGVIFIIITRYVNGIAVGEEDLHAENIISNMMFDNVVENTVKTVRYRLTKYRQNNIDNDENTNTDTDMDNINQLFDISGG